MNEPKAITYHGTMIAKLFDLTPRRVQQLAAEGIIPKSGHNRYELVPAIKGYIKYLRGRAIAGDITGDEGSDKKRLTKARADIAEMEAERLAGEVVDVDHCERVWTDAVANFRQRTLAVAHKAAPMVAPQSDLEQCHDIIESHLHDALAELSRIRIIVDSEAAATEGGERDAAGGEAAAEADDIGVGGQIPKAIF